ncbi:cystatin-B-like [Hydra vulgaris]|uniref:Cystatin-B-like n=1 Tax=Hydra vulgaris TaxID=6087 RepID=A0ABM4BG44_HYDVU
MENIESTSCEATQDAVTENAELPYVEIVTDYIKCDDHYVPNVAPELQTEEQAPGEFSYAEETANDKIQEIINKIKDEVSKQTGQSLEVYEAISYISQVVAGMVYIIKVHVGDDNCIHVRVYLPLSNDDVEATPELNDIQVNKSKEDKIDFF